MRAADTFQISHFHIFQSELMANFNVRSVILSLKEEHRTMRYTNGRIIEIYGGSLTDPFSPSASFVSSSLTSSCVCWQFRNHLSRPLHTWNDLEITRARERERERERERASAIVFTSVCRRHRGTRLEGQLRRRFAENKRHHYGVENKRIERQESRKRGSTRWLTASQMY